MNLHSLKLFYQVAVTGSFTRAAEIMHISQPAVSSQIKRFEHKLGMALFKKEGRGVVLTNFAEELLERTKTLIASEKYIETFIEEYKSAKVGTLHIVATYLPANFLIPKWAALFKSENEDVSLIITTTNTKSACEQLKNYKADLAIFGGLSSEMSAEVLYEQLFEDELWFVVAATHPLANSEITLKEMVEESFIMREEGSSMREYLRSICHTHQVKMPKVSLQFSGINETIRSVKAGYGASLISSLAVREYVENGQLARVYVQDVHIPHNIAVCTRRNEKQSTLLQKFIKIIKSDFK